MKEPERSVTDDIFEINKIHDEIEPTLVQRAADWKKLQKRILDRLDEYRTDSALASSIYRIYAREDRQSYLGIAHPHLKQFYKIAEEIHLNRNGRDKQRAGKARKSAKAVNFDLYDVTDIIGVTIVCPYKDDVEQIKSKIEDDIKEHRFSEIKAKSLEDRLYQAHHFVVGVDEEPFGELCCEIQIKTAIQDAFSWKTHGLAYKSNGPISNWYMGQFESIMAVLRAADTIAEDITKRIREDNSSNDEKRRYGRYLLSIKMASDIESMTDNPRYQAFETSIADLRGQLALPNTSRNGRRIHDVKRDIDAVLKGVANIAGMDKFLFRLTCLCAIVNPRQDAPYWLDRIFDRFLNDMDRLRRQEDAFTPSHWYNSLGLSLAHYCRGDLKRACNVLERSLAKASDAPARTKAPFHANLAYYYAERTAQSSSDHFRALALDHHRKAIAAYGETVPPRDLDSLGYVLVETGVEMDTVQRGLEMCVKASDLLSKTSAGDANTLNAGDFFLRLHKEIAYKRLAALAAKECDSGIPS